MDEQRAWIKSRRKRRLRLLAVTLAFCLLFTTYPDILEALSVYAAGTQSGDGTVYVAGFAGLPEEVREQIVPVGTGTEALMLPDMLEATVAIPEGEVLPEDTEEETPAPPESAEEETQTPPEGTEEETESSETEGTETEESADNTQPKQEANGENADDNAVDSGESAPSVQMGQTEDAKPTQESHTVTIEDITWQSEPVYDGNTEGIYIFTAVLPEGYALMEGVSLPQITVTVQADSADSVIQALLERIAALPDAEEYLAGEPETEAGGEAYEKWMEGLYAYAEEALAIWEEYDALTGKQQAQIPEEAFTKLAVWVELAETAGESAQVMAETDTATSGNCGATGNEGNVTWSFDASSGKLTISGTGAMADFAIEATPWFKHNDSITEVEISNGVTKIGSYAFYACNMPSIVIPESVKEIGSFAFYCCKKMNSVNIPNGVKIIDCNTFSSNSLKSISIPDSVTEIRSGAFFCSDLTSITIPNSVTSIGYQAFQSTDITSVTIPASVNSIGYSAFAGCNKLKTVVFEGTTPPTLVPSSGNTDANVFKNCGFMTDGDYMTGITVPEGYFETYRSEWETTFPDFASYKATHMHQPCGARHNTKCSHGGASCNFSHKFDQEITSDTTALTVGGYYYLAEDVTLSSAITINGATDGGTVNICLNGHTLTGNNCVVFNITGNGADTTTVNICDCSEDKSGTIKVNQTTNDTPNVINVTSATLNVYGGTIEASGIGIYGVALHSNGALNMYGGKISTLAYPICVYENSTGTNINIYDGDISSSGANAICSTSSSIIDISGGTIHSTSYAAIKTNDVNLTISGNSEITNDSGTYAIEYAKSGTNNPTLTITGGTISGNAGIKIGGGKVDISGGTITASGTAIFNLGTDTTIGGTAQVTCTGYNQAILNGNNVSGATNTGVSVKIQGGTITSSGGWALQNSAGATATISGGTIESTGNSSDTIHNNAEGTLNITGGKVISKGTAINNYGTVTIEGTAEKGITSSGSYTLHNKAGATATISGGTIENTKVGSSSSDNGVAVYNLGTITSISGNAVVTSTGFYGRAFVNKGTAEITGGEITSTHNCAYAVQNIGTLTISDKAVVKSTGESNDVPIVNGEDRVDNSSVSMTIKGGTFEQSGGTSGLAICNMNKANLDISGGDFTSMYFEFARNIGTMTISGGTYTSTYEGSNNKRFENSSTSSTLNLSGNPNFNDIGIKLNGTSVINITGALTYSEACPIYVNDDPVTADSPVIFTTGWSTYMPNAEISQYFTSGLKYCTVDTKNNEGILRPSKVTFDYCDDSTGTETKDVNSNAKVDSFPNDPTKTGYVFGGWYNAKTGGTKFTADSTFTTGDTTLYARWEQCTAHTLANFSNPTETQHTGVCTVCGLTVTENHEFTYGASYEIFKEECKKGCGHRATATLTVPENADLTYTGSAIEPLEIKYSGDKWVGKKPTVEYTNNTNAGIARAQLWYNGTGTAPTEFKIKPKSLTDNMVTIDPTSYPHTESDVEPDVTVKDGEKVLVKGTDYTVSCENNTAPGTATVKIIGAGNYTGEIKKTFTIKQIETLPADKPLTDCVNIPTPSGSGEDNLYGSDITITPKDGWTVGTDPNNLGSGVNFTEETGPEGNTIPIYLKDPKGNFYKTDFTYKLDKTPPAVSGKLTIEGANISFTPTESGKAYWIVSDTVPTAEQVKEQSAQKGGVLDITSGTAVNLAVTAAEKAQTVYVVLEDAAGNLSNVEKTEISAQAHTHTFSTEWSKDENNHWHAATCGHTTEVSDKAAHDWDTGEVTSAATCTQKGVKTYTCSVCSGTKTEEIPAIGHEYKVTWKWAEAADDFTATATITCTHADSDWHCDFAETKTTGKTAGDVKVTSEETKTASCEAAGERSYTASLAYDGKTYTCETVKKETIPAKGHTLKKTEAKKPTSTEAGNKEYWTCSGCGKLYEDEQGNTETDSSKVTIPATGDREVWSTVITSDGVKIVGYSGSDTAVEVPSEIDGQPVTAIGKDAFSGCTGLTTIMIPDGLDTKDAGIIDTAAKITYKVDKDGKITITSVTPGKDSDGGKKPVTLPDTIGGKKPEIPDDVKEAMKNILHEHKGGVATCTQKAVCEICGKGYGKLAGHDYEGSWQYDASGHWKSCNRCKAEDAKHSHHYDNDRDSMCNDCGYKRVIKNPDDEQPTSPNPVQPTPQPEDPVQPALQPEDPVQPTPQPNDTPDNKPENEQKPEDKQKPDDTPGQGSTESAQTKEAQTVQVVIDGGKLTMTGDLVTTGNITETSETTTILQAEDGAVIVTVVCEEESYTAGVKDTVAVTNAVLYSEQVELVNDGETIEIRVDVKDISETVPGQDQEVIESGLAECRKEMPDLTLGIYVDISIFIKVGEGDWNAVTSTTEPIEVVIGIPEELKGDGREFYIIRSHDGEYTLLPDTDDNPDTITVSTDMFSAYALVYKQADKAEVSAPGESSTKCWLCHIYYALLGIPCFIWLAVIVAVFQLIGVVIWRRKEKVK